MWVTPVCALFSWGWVIPHLRDWELTQQQGFGFVQGELQESLCSELMGKGTETPSALLARAKEEQGPLLNIHAVRQGLFTPLTTAIQH